jgi:hypothetical protein
MSIQEFDNFFDEYHKNEDDALVFVLVRHLPNICEVYLWEEKYDEEEMQQVKNKMFNLMKEKKFIKVLSLALKKGNLSRFNLTISSLIKEFLENTKDLNRSLSLKYQQLREKLVKEQAKKFKDKELGDWLISLYLDEEPY